MQLWDGVLVVEQRFHLQADKHIFSNFWVVWDYFIHSVLYSLVRLACYVVAVEWISAGSTSFEVLHHMAMKLTALMPTIH
jgi:hypothetical protein